MPAQFRIHVEKFWASLNVYWTNVYYANAADMAAADTLAGGIVTAEKACYPSGVTITKTRVDDNTPNTNVYITTVRNTVGTRTAMSTGSWLPLYNTARVDFSAADGGSPSRKYIRGTLNEDDLAGPYALETGTFTRMNAYAAAIIAIGLVDVDGAALTSGATFTAPQIHDLHRRSKRPSTP